MNCRDWARILGSSTCCPQCEYEEATDIMVTEGATYPTADARAKHQTVKGMTYRVLGKVHLTPENEMMFKLTFAPLMEGKEWASDYDTDEAITRQIEVSNLLDELHKKELGPAAKRQQIKRSIST